MTCEENLHTDTNLRRHLRDVHGSDTRATCDRCLEKFSDVARLQQHRRTCRRTEVATAKKSTGARRDRSVTQRREGLQPPKTPSTSSQTPVRPADKTTPTPTARPSSGKAVVHAPKRLTNSVPYAVRQKEKQTNVKDSDTKTQSSAQVTATRKQKQQQQQVEQTMRSDTKANQNKTKSANQSQKVKATKQKEGATKDATHKQKPAEKKASSARTPASQASSAPAVDVTPIKSSGKESSVSPTESVKATASRVRKAIVSTSEEEADDDEPPHSPQTRKPTAATSSSKTVATRGRKSQRARTRRVASSSSSESRSPDKEKILFGVSWNNSCFALNVYDYYLSGISTSFAFADEGAMRDLSDPCAERASDAVRQR